MPAVRLAMAQINPTVGRLKENSDLVFQFCKRAKAENCQLVVFPEMALSGYPIEDLALDEDFLTANQDALEDLAKRLNSEGFGELFVLIGHPAKAAKPTSWAIGQNVASVIHDGKVLLSYAKHHLPNYSVFDEYRTFVPGSELKTFEIEGLRFAPVICEDIWQKGGPVAELAKQGVDVCLVINGSPFEVSKTDSRLELARSIASDQNTAVVYVNLVGGQDDLVFDGFSFAIDADGNERARSSQFREDLTVLEIASKNDLKCDDSPKKFEDNLEAIWQALVLALQDYVEKNGFKSVILGLSGGIDSAVCAAIAVDALGPDRVFGVSMPSRYSSEHSKNDAKVLADNLRISLASQPIDSLVKAFDSELALSGTAAENLQARLRGVILMGLANQHGHLVLTTGNKTEHAVGYSTIYGDSVGGFAPIKDIEKSLVWELAKHRNQVAVASRATPPIPESSISKPPSAELRPDQKDEDSLPPYHLLDEILRLHVEQRLSRSKVIELGFDSETVNRVLDLVKSAEWKRRQGAIGPKITKLAFGRERRVPITGKSS